MAAGTYNLQIDQGSDYASTLTITESGVAKDLTGYSARAQMRPTKSSSTLSATFTCTVTDASGGVLKMELSNSITKNLAAGVYYYDLEIYTAADASVTRLLEGQVTVDPEVTR